MLSSWSFINSCFYTRILFSYKIQPFIKVSIAKQNVLRVLETDRASNSASTTGKLLLGGWEAMAVDKWIGGNSSGKAFYPKSVVLCKIVCCQKYKKAYKKAEELTGNILGNCTEPPQEVWGCQQTDFVTLIFTMPTLTSLCKLELSFSGTLYFLFLEKKIWTNQLWPESQVLKTEAYLQKIHVSGWCVV